MKTQHLMAMCLLAASTLFGQQGIVTSQIHNKQPTASDADTKYSVVHRDANSRVWRRTTYEATASGTMVPHVHKYTELATGMNYKDPQTGQWVESDEQIESVPTGGAEAIHGQHQAYFPYDIYDGAIELVTPDGRHLKNRPMGIAYNDGTNSVLISELKHSVGQILPSGNQIIYTNAFTDFAADIVYTYRKNGFEADLVFRERPPTPEAFGLGSKKARLELWTEFFDAPDPERIENTIGSDGLEDATLKFGNMAIVRGRAFATGQLELRPLRPAKETINPSKHGLENLVSKTWTRSGGRTFLIESVGAGKMEGQFETLPFSATFQPPVALTDSHIRRMSHEMLLPARRTPIGSRHSLALAKAELSRKPGVVLDYVILDSDTSNMTFEGGTTYFISGDIVLNLGGTTTVEGGTVIKYANPTEFGEPALSVSSLVCHTTAYNPAVFTAQDDDTVGEKISGSTGDPILISSDEYLVLNSNAIISNCRFCYAGDAIYAYEHTVDIWDSQFVHCENAIAGGMGTGVFRFHNALVSDCAQCVAFGNIVAENLTCNANGSALFGVTSAMLTNSIIVGSMSGFSGTLVTNCTEINPSGPIFQTVGAAGYYLTNGSPYRDDGTTNISPQLLAELRLKTTYPPIVRSNIVFSSNTTFSPQAQRDADLPDIGYHYDPIDYLLNADIISNATLTVTSGTVIGAFTTEGFEAVRLEPNSKIICTGTANNRNYIVFYNTVQEQTTNGWSDGTQILDSDEGSVYSFGSFGSGLFTFTTWSSLGGKTFIWDETLNRGPLVFNHCEFDTGKIFNYSLDMAITNCLFVKDYMMQNQDDESVPFNLTMDNCSLLDGNLVLFYDGVFVGGGSFILQNNFFEQTAIDDESLSAYSTANDGYVTGYDRLNPHLASDTILTASPVYQTGPFGLYYLPSGNALINAGSNTANSFGLYHFTTTTNQVKETNSVVDLGYHYVAVDANGLPFDTDSDGIPDYLEDVNGDGIYGTGDLSNWQLFSTDGTGMGDGWEIKYFGSLGNDPNADPDGDGLTNLQESQFGLNPFVDDSTQSGSRLNYIYDADGWLNTVSGVRNSSITLDDQGNIQGVSE